MDKAKIIKFAKRNGYDNALPLGRWREYEVYEPVFNGKEVAYVGPPLIILVKGDEIRMSTPEEAYQQLDESDDEDEYDQIEEVEKFNPYHDRLGRFASADSATSFTYKPGQGKMYDNAIERERSKMAQPKQNLVAGLGQKHAEEIESLVQNSTDEVKGLWDKYADEIKVGDKEASRIRCDYDGEIFVHIEDDAAGGYKNAPYQATMHESGHSIDRAISRKVGYRYSERYNGGEFDDMLVKEGNDYIKNFQQKLSAERGEKVPIGEARKELGKRFIYEGGRGVNSVSDILEGATKGKFEGPSGHGKEYWIGKNAGNGVRIGAHKVSTEAFAEMFSATTANPEGLAKFKEIFPESYKIFQKMIKEAASYE